MNDYISNGVNWTGMILFILKMKGEAGMTVGKIISAIQARDDANPLIAALDLNTIYLEVDGELSRLRFLEKIEFIMNDNEICWRLRD